MADGVIPPVLLVGCGRMGSALLHGWQAQGLSPSFVLDPAPTAMSMPHRQVADAAFVPEDFRPAAIVLAVKPQRADAALAAIAPLAANTLVLSIMAGCTLANLAAFLPDGCAIVRAMPNTPAAIGQGITVACAGRHVRPSQRALAGRLLDSVGTTEWVEDEALLDPVTALSGSGPAYVFLLAELLEQAGREQGLPAALARTLARRTVSGAGALLDASPEMDAAVLRRAVTSPGGTTEQALAVLMQPEAWPSAIRAAIEAATQRSRTLAR
ncbi:pyrroline-5-carboxylate reductase [Lichenicoccus sp.]|uniref:pyrroline-5-carboxylate reductase n=1 Tax=Lichenicoccus sp. TaxID=2781899 RepID=UPI003D0FB14C